jgi:hypothetical protein
MAVLSTDDCMAYQTLSWDRDYEESFMNVHVVHVHVLVILQFELHFALIYIYGCSANCAVSVA